jgi:hypothetical protein
MVRDGVFGQERKKSVGRPKWKLVDEELCQELDISSFFCIPVKSKAMKKTADADKEEWDILDDIDFSGSLKSRKSRDFGMARIPVSRGPICKQPLKVRSAMKPMDGKNCVLKKKGGIFDSLVGSIEVQSPKRPHGTSRKSLRLNDVVSLSNGSSTGPAHKKMNTPKVPPNEMDEIAVVVRPSQCPTPSRQQRLPMAESSPTRTRISGYAPTMSPKDLASTKCKLSSPYHETCSTTLTVPQKKKTPTKPKVPANEMEAIAVVVEPSDCSTPSRRLRLSTSENSPYRSKLRENAPISLMPPKDAASTKRKVSSPDHQVSNPAARKSRKIQSAGARRSVLQD